MSVCVGWESASKVLSSDVFLSYLCVQIQALNGKKFRELFQDPRMMCFWLSPSSSYFDNTLQAFFNEAVKDDQKCCSFASLGTHRAMASFTGPHRLGDINLMVDSGPKARSCPLPHLTMKTITSSAASPSVSSWQVSWMKHLGQPFICAWHEVHTGSGLGRPSSPPPDNST